MNNQIVQDTNEEIKKELGTMIPINSLSTISSQDFIEIYLSRFNKNSINNTHLGIASLHFLTGAILRHSKIWFGDEYIDMRVHPLCFQPSGSGKTPAYNFTYNIAVELELTVTKITKMTVASAIGSFITEDEKDDTGTYRQVQKQRAGEFGKYQLIMFNEATAALEDTELIRYICEVCDPIGRNHLVKSLAQSEDNIVTYPEASFFMITYLPRALINAIILDSGIAPRCLMTCKDKSIEEKSVINREIINRMGQKLDRTHDYDVIIQMFRNIMDFFSEGIEFKFKEDAKEVLLKYEEEMKISIRELPMDMHEHLTVFQTRYLLMCPRLAAHRAAFELRDIINVHDIKYAIIILRDTWDDLIEFAELKINITSTIKNELDRTTLLILADKKCINDDETILVSKLKKIVAEKGEVSLKSSLRSIKRLIDEKYIIEKDSEKDARSKLCYLSDIGKKLIKHK